MKKFLIWMVVTCIGCGNLWAADRTVKGYVLDKEGTPLPGAYVYDEDKHTAVTNEDGYFEFVNPVIIAQSGSQKGPEGCLSVPGRSEEVVRPDKITVVFQDRNGKKYEGKFEGFLARACCHEFDHLDGILYFLGYKDSYIEE